MREIEFRAWDKEINEMIFQQKQSPCFGRFEGESWCSLEDVLFYYKQSFVLMQYTGLKDKNGTKIYEGDIIKFTRLAGNPTTGTYSLTDICVIKWIDWSCSFRLCYGTQEQKILNRYEYEVIGNTYENPELR